MPVPPPTRATGRPPSRWRWSSPKIGTRWPTWSESAGRIEADVAGDRPAGREPRRRARASSRGGCPARRARPAARRGPRPSSVALVTGSRVESSRPDGRLASVRSTVRSRPLCYRATTDADQPRAASAPPSGARTSTASSLGKHARRIAAVFLFGDAPHRWPGDGQRCAPRGSRVQPVLRGPPRPRRRAHEHPVRAADGRLRPDRQDRAGPLRRRSSASSSPSTSCPARSSTPRRHRGQDVLAQRRLRPDRASSRPPSTP